MLSAVNSNEELSPAFQKRWYGFFFICVFLFFLTLPFIPKSSWVERDKLYAAIGGNTGRFQYLSTEIMQEGEDIDVLFVGSSSLGVGIDARYVKQELSKLLGREAVVYITTHRKVSTDYDYIVTRDILDKRNVKLVILANDKYSGYKQSLPYLNNYFTIDFSLHKDVIAKLDNKMQEKMLKINWVNGLRQILTPLKDSKHAFNYNDTCFESVLEEYFGGCPKVKKGEKIKNNFFDRVHKTEIPLEKIIRRTLNIRN